MTGAHFSGPIIDCGWIDGDKWRLKPGFRFYLTADEGPLGEFVDVPDLFTTNFASTPRITWSVFPPTGKYAQAAATHDKLFLAPVIRTRLTARPCTFHEANRIFLLGSEVLGVSWPVRRFMFRMLEVGGHESWTRYRTADRLAGATPSPTHTSAELLAYVQFKCAPRVCAV